MTRRCDTVEEGAEVELPQHPVEPGPADEGATSVEYALMASLIAVVIIASVALLGQETADLFLVPCGALGPC